MRVYFKLNSSKVMQLIPANESEFETLVKLLRSLESWGKSPNVKISPLTVVSADNLSKTITINSSFLTSPKAGCEDSGSISKLLENNGVTLVDPAIPSEKESLLPRWLRVR